jgi:hypothetical protein
LYSERLEAVVTEDMDVMTALLNGTLHHRNVTPHTSVLVAHSVYEALTRHHERRVRRQTYRMTGLDKVLADSIQSRLKPKPPSVPVNDEEGDEDDSSDDESSGLSSFVTLDQSQHNLDSYYQPVEPPALKFAYNRPLPHGPCNVPRRGVSEAEFYATLEFMMTEGLLFENMENQITFARPVHMWTYSRVLNMLPPHLQPSAMFGGNYDAIRDHGFAARSEACLRGELPPAACFPGVFRYCGSVTVLSPLVTQPPWQHKAESSCADTTKACSIC